MATGIADTALKTRNCGTCDLRSECKDKRKSRKFCCTLFQSERSRDDDPSDRDFLSYMRGLAKTESIVPDNFQINDAHLPTAPNFFTWTTGKQFLNPDPFPYPKQVEMGMHLYGDICSNCSGNHPWYTSIPHDCEVMEIPKKLQLYKFGVCPRCQRSRLQNIANGKENHINELIGIIGQRCLTANTLINTSNGVKTIGELAKGAPTGWSQLGFGELYVEIGVTSHAMVDAIFVSEPGPVYKITFASGRTIEATIDHPLLTSDGWLFVRNFVAGETRVVCGYGNRKYVAPEIPVKEDAEFERIFTEILPPEFAEMSFERKCQLFSFLSHNKHRSSKIMRANYTLIITILSHIQKNCRFSAFFGDMVISTAYTTIRDYDTVVNIELFSGSEVTYDIRVPNHHMFIANGLVSHNSGKCLDGSSRIATQRGRIPLREVQIGDSAYSQGSWATVSNVIRSNPKYMSRVTTQLGYEIICTDDHRHYTPAGFVAANKAKTLMVEVGNSFPPDTLRKRLESENWYIGFNRLDKKEYSQLLDQSKDIQRRVIAECTSETLASGALCLGYCHELLAKAVQQALLSFGVVCWRVRKRLVIDPEYFRRYLRNVGGLPRNVAVSVWNFRKQHHNTVAQHDIDLLKSYVKGALIINSGYLRPEAMQNFTTILTALKHDSFTKRDALRLINALTPNKKVSVQLNDRFLQACILNLARRILSLNYAWTRIVDRTRLGLRECWDLTVPGKANFNANGICTHNSAGMSYPFSYHAHRLLKMKNPNAFYGIKQGTVLEMTFIGIQYGNVKRYVYDPFLSSVQDSPWFAEYHALLDDVARKRGEEPLYKLMDSFIHYRNASFRIAPASPSRRALRGATRVGFAQDEISHFSSDQKKINISGLEVWRALTRSLQTVRNKSRILQSRGVVDVVPAISVAISSPYEAGDPGMVLYNKPTTNTWAIKLPTWEFNPEYTFESLATEFERDPISAWRDLGARPPLSSVAFISGAKHFKQVIKMNELPAADLKTIQIRTKTGQAMLTGKLKWRWVDEDVPKILALDAGKTVNSFAFCVMHLDEDDFPVYDVLGAITPQPNRPVSLQATLRRVLIPLIERMGIKVVIADRWQSMLMLESLEEDCEIATLHHTLKYGEMQVWRELLYSGNMEFPKLEMPLKEVIQPRDDVTHLFIDKPVAELVWQAVSVIDVPGKTVEKPSAGNDDLFRACVLAYTGACLPEVKEVMEGGDPDKGGVGFLASIASSSGAKTVRAKNYIPPDEDEKRPKRFVIVTTNKSRNLR